MTTDTTWSVDLPNWQSVPDPEVPGETVWFHTDYDGTPVLALVWSYLDGKPCVTVLAPVMITPTEIDGCHLGSYPDWDSALDYALGFLEDADPTEY